MRELQALGAAPFIFPAMGSHGGATAEGQRGVLAEWGITPERMGCEVHSSMEVVQIGETPTGIPVFCDAGAFNSDGIVLVNRVKIHTDFHGPTESGLTKMMAIGLGKRQGAELIHAHGTRGLREEIPRVAAVQLARSPILCGVAIVEDGAHHVSMIKALPAQAIPLEEPAISGARASANGAAAGRRLRLSDRGSDRQGDQRRRHGWQHHRAHVSSKASWNPSRRAWACCWRAG